MEKRERERVKKSEVGTQTYAPVGLPWMCVEIKAALFVRARVSAVSFKTFSNPSQTPLPLSHPTPTSLHRTPTKPSS